MFDKHWLWNGSCPCGYKSRWYPAEWLSRIATRIHTLTHLHVWGNVTIAAKGRGHRKGGD